MKKSSVVFLLISPLLLVGCNKRSSLSFNNPFPEDKYSKVGFNFTSDEIARTALSGEQKELVNNTASKKTIYDKEIKSCVSEIHYRDYTRAFAGVFKEGYGCSNILVDEKRNTHTQTIDATHLAGKWADSEINNIIDYSYGKQNTTLNTRTYKYLGASQNTDPKTIKAVVSNEDRVVTQTVESDSKSFLSSDVVAWKQTSGSWIDKNKAIFDRDNTMDIKQSDFIYSTDQCTVPAASTIDPQDQSTVIVLIKEEKTKHGTDGKYTLKDARQFLAMDNTLTVTKLKKAVSGDHLYVSHVRRYEETVITSEEIEPNVQITMLQDPIVVNYAESIHEFSTITSECGDTIKDINDVEEPK